MGVSELLLLPIHGSLSLSLSLSLIQRNNGDTNSRQIQMTIFRCPLEEGACACVLSSSHFVFFFLSLYIDESFTQDAKKKDVYFTIIIFIIIFLNKKT